MRLQVQPSDKPHLQMLGPLHMMADSTLAAVTQRRKAGPRPRLYADLQHPRNASADARTSLGQHTFSASVKGRFRRLRTTCDPTTRERCANSTWTCCFREIKKGAYRQPLLDGCIPIVNVLISLHPAQGCLQPTDPLQPASPSSFLRAKTSRVLCKSKPNFCLGPPSPPQPRLRHNASHPGSARAGHSARPAAAAGSVQAVPIRQRPAAQRRGLTLAKA